MNSLKLSMPGRALVPALIAVAALCAPSFAQQTTGSVTGSVTDSSGAVVAGAEVRLINTGTGAILKTTTNQEGNFQFLLTPPGVYSVEVASKGFKTFRREGIIVEVNRSLAVPVTMEVGAVTETVEVRDGTPLLEPNTSALGTVMDSKKVEDLPLNGRNPLGLANLIPTVEGIGYFGGELLSTWRMGQVTIAGGTPLNNAFLIDGIANEKMTDYSAMAFLSADNTQEFKVISNNMSAEYGRTGGGVISFISKSGTNEFHGLAYEYVRNTDFDSNEFFQNKAGAPRTAEHINQFGGTFGGPIKKEKLFFFFSLDEYRERKAASETITSPTAAERAGNFSGLGTSSCAPITIYDPYSTTADPANPGQYIRQPFPNNTIPSNLISPVATAILKYYPQPNLPGQACTGAQNLFLTSPVPINNSNVSIRIDYNITGTRRLSGRFSRDMLDWGFANYFGNIADTDGRHILDPRRTGVLEYTDALTPTLLLDARIGVNREQEHTIAPGHNFDVTKLGFSQQYASLIQSTSNLGYGFPNINITDLTPFGRPDSTGNPTATGTAGANLTKIEGSHNIKFGYEQRLYRRSDWGTSNSSGTFSFSRAFTQANPTVASSTSGYGLATFLLGAPTSGTITHTLDSVDTMNFSALFIQDDWKAARKLTLNLGLRWEYEGPIKERRNIYPNFSPSVPSALSVPGLPPLTGGYTFPGTNGIPNGVTATNYKNFGPRFGFAYQLNAKTVLRGGYGISYIPTFGLGSSAAGASFAVPTSMITSVNSQGLIPTDSFANPFPNGISLPAGSSLGTLTSVGQAANAGYLRDIYRGYAQEWNFTVQHSPWANWLFEAAYVGNKGTHLTMLNQNLDQLPDTYLALGSQLISTVNNPFYGNPAIPASSSLAAAKIPLQQLLLPYPQFLNVLVNNYIGASFYNAFTFKVERRFARGFSLLASYTAAKLMDNMQGTGRPGAVGGAAVQDWYNLKAEWARSYQDVPQRLVATASWQIPFHPTHSMLRAISGGWQINGIWTWQSGFPIGLTASSTGVNDRPNVVSGVSLAAKNQSITSWFNNILAGQPGAAFALPPAYTYGNVSRTLPNINGPRYFDVDASVFKDFKLRERLKLQFRAEAYNLTNTPSFSVPVASVTSATFGQITSTSNGGPQHYREIQLSLRLSF
jgi:hypothetical protein